MFTIANVAVNVENEVIMRKDITKSVADFINIFSSLVVSFNGL